MGQFFSAMGIDIQRGGRVKTKKRTCKSQNPYVRLLCKLYKFLARRTDSKFNKVIYKRMNMSRRNRPPLSLPKISSAMEGKDGKIAVVVGTVTDDKRLFDVPKLSVCATRFTETARAHCEGWWRLPHIRCLGFAVSPGSRHCIAAWSGEST